MRKLIKTKTKRTVIYIVYFQDGFKKENHLIFDIYKNGHSCQDFEVECKEGKGWVSYLWHIKKWPLLSDFEAECKEGKVMSAVCKYYPEVK